MSTVITNVPLVVNPDYQAARRSSMKKMAGSIILLVAIVGVVVGYLSFRPDIDQFIPSFRG